MHVRLIYLQSFLGQQHCELDLNCEILDKSPVMLAQDKLHQKQD